MFDFMKKSFPGTWKFIADFFEALNGNRKGHSLRKWLAVGFFWLCAVVTIRYTTSENLEGVLVILTSMITALIITYSVSNHADNKLQAGKNPSDNTTAPTDETQA